jgi:hypothetical protein
MLEPKYERRQAAVKEAYVGLVGWAWIAASIAAVYYLFRAIFFGGSWWTFVGTSVVAWVLSSKTSAESENRVAPAGCAVAGS